MQLHELAHVVQHIVVLGGGRCHLLDDGGNVTENGRVQQSYWVVVFLWVGGYFGGGKGMVKVLFYLVWYGQGQEATPGHGYMG